MSDTAHSWFQMIIQGLSDMFFTACTEERERTALEAFAEIRRLVLEVAR